MIETNTRVLIVSSDDLSAMRLSGLVGQGGRVAERIFSARGKLLGYMVCLDEPFQGECLWFFPENALQADE